MNWEQTTFGLYNACRSKAMVAGAERAGNNPASGAFRVAIYVFIGRPEDS